MPTLFALFFFIAAASAQPALTLAPPSDPLEPVTGTPQDVTSVEQRAAAVALLNQAVDHYSMHAKTTPAQILQMAFHATASTLFPAGAGQLRETWISGQNWRWDASLGSYSLLRISSGGVAWDQQTPQAIPLRIKMLANAVLAPLQFVTLRVSPTRIASVTWKGAQITCMLIDPSLIPSTQATGRRWGESEFCVDPATGLLDIYSEAPGIYVFYDYTNALKFHDRILPGTVTIDENGAAVVEAQLTSIPDTDPSDTAPFTPTAQMKSQGPAVVLFAPGRGTRIVPTPNIQPGAAIEPVVVHVAFDEQGKVAESEVLQSNSFSAQALALVAQTPRFAELPQADGTPPRQRESFIRVEFTAANQKP